MNKKKRMRGIMLFSLLTAVSVFALYCFFGAPPLTPEMAMHQRERQELIGPSKIMAEGELKCGGYDRFLLGKTEYGYCIYTYKEGDFFRSDVLTYEEEGEKVTVISLGIIAEYSGDVPDEGGLTLPVFVIPDSLRAVSAKLTVKAQYEGKQYEASDSAVLEQDVYFVFKTDMDHIHPHVRDFWARILQDGPPVYHPISGTVTLELFDIRGERIETVHWEYQETE